MVTGGKGIHVIAPLVPRAEWPEVKSFAHRLAQAVAQSDPSPAPTTNTTTPAKDAADPPAKKARTDFVCAHQDQIKDLMNQRKSLISCRLSLLQEARADAAEHVVRALPLQNHIVDAVLVQQLPKQQSGRPGPDDCDFCPQYLLLPIL